MRRPAAYGTTAKTFHWGMALMIAGMVPLGFVMADMALSPQKLQLYSWHKSFGVVIFLLAALRLGWRIMRPPPALPVSMTATERRVSAAVHMSLYGCLFALPLSGWFMSAAAGLPVVVFRVWQLPNPVAASEPLRAALSNLHFAIGLLMLALLALHTAAAIYHHLGRRDDTLRRMLPFARTELPRQ